MKPGRIVVWSAITVVAVTFAANHAPASVAKFWPIGKNS